MSSVILALIPLYCAGTLAPIRRCIFKLKHDWWLCRGKEFGHWFTKKSSLKGVGIFKGMIRLVKTGDQACPLDLRTLLNPRPFVVRVYVLKGRGLTPMDSDGKADPYVRLKLGKTKISDKEK